MVFVLRSLRGQEKELAAAAVAIPSEVFVLLTLLCTASVCLTAALHATVLSTLSPLVPSARARYAYAAGQIARYVPGKVFGVVLEAKLLAPLTTFKQVLGATLEQTMLAYLWAASLGVSVLMALWIPAPWPLLLVPITLWFLWLAQRHAWATRFGRRLGWYAGQEEAPHSTTRRTQANRGTMLLLVQWAPFFCAWFVLAGTTETWSAWVWLAASYLLASVAGSFMVLLPAGLVVREATFVGLGRILGLDAPELLAWALAMRLALTLADVAAMPVLWVWGRQRG